MRSLVGTLVPRIVNRSPVPYAGRTNLAVPFRQLNDAERHMQALGTNGTLFAIVDKLASGCAGVEWKLWRKAASGRKEDRVAVTRHAALDLVRKPNPFYSGQHFVEATQQHFELTGEMWWIVARDGRSRLPLELWPARPDRMEPVPSATDFLAGYVYTGPDGEKVPLGIDDVICSMRPSPLDPYRGIGPMQAALLDIEQARAAKEWNRNFFRNSAEPGGIVQIGRRLSDAEFREHQTRWAEQHQGVSAAHRVALLEGGMQWVERKYTMRDMQFVELRNVSREEIREAFGFPKSMLGAVDDINRANAEAGEYVFARWLLEPRLDRRKGALNERLLPLFGATDLEFDYESPVDEDEAAENAELTARANAAKTLVDAGYDPAGVLEVVDLPELAFTPPPTPAPPTTPDEQPPAVEPGASSPPAVPGRRAPAALMAATDTPRQDWELRIDRLLEQWQNVTGAQTKELADQIERIVDSGKPEELATLKASSDEGAALLAEAMFAQADAAGKRMAMLAAAQGVSIHPVTPIQPTANALKPRVAKFVAGLAADLVAIAKVTASFLAGGISNFAGREALRAWAPGVKGSDVAKAVTTSIGDLTDATLRKELGGAIWGAENEGRFATFEQAEADGVAPARYIANETNDKNTCEPCAEIDGREWKSWQDAQLAYPFSGYVGCEGGDRCRGSVEPKWK